MRGDLISENPWAMKATVATEVRLYQVKPRNHQSLSSRTTRLQQSEKASKAVQGVTSETPKRTLRPPIM